MFGMSDKVLTWPRSLSLGSTLSGFLPVIDSFYVVAIGVEHESAVIILVILRSKARFTIVSSTRSQSRFVEFLDLSTIVCPEGNMESCHIP